MSIYNTIAEKAARELNIDFSKEKFNLNDLARGMQVEYEHGAEYPRTNVTNDDPILTAKIALAHLYEPKETGPNTPENTQYDYYDGLEIMESAKAGYWRNTNAESYWLNKKIGWYVVIVLLVISVYMLYTNINWSEPSVNKYMIMSSVIILGSSYLLFTWK
ncbi:hypothetical protein PV-S19_0210 [Pacmanvirus S19]|nr:hypothetical protein PV-S19_0210 [Pacmanvirus S19]